MILYINTHLNINWKNLGTNYCLTFRKLNYFRVIPLLPKKIQKYCDLKGKGTQKLMYVISIEKIHIEFERSCVAV